MSIILRPMLRRVSIILLIYLASCHTALKEYQKSKDTYEKGLKKDPQNAELKTGLEKVQMLIFSGSGESEADQQ